MATRDKLEHLINSSSYRYINLIKLTAWKNGKLAIAEYIFTTYQFQASIYMNLKGQSLEPTGDDQLLLTDVQSGRDRQENMAPSECRLSGRPFYLCNAGRPQFAWKRAGLGAAV